MRISTRLALQSGLIFVAALAVVLVLWLSLQRESRVFTAAEALQEASRAQASMKLLTYDMRYWGQSRAQAQWDNERGRLLVALDSAVVAGDDLAGLEDIERRVSERLPEIVEALRKSLRERPRSEELVDIRLRHLIVEQAEIAFQIRQLIARNSERIKDHDEWLRALFLAMLMLFVLVSAASAWLLYTATVRPLLRLRSVAGQVKQGDLSIRTGICSNDEIGDLARDFDAMTTRLEHTLASRAELQREIDRRQQAETRRERTVDELRRSNAELARFAYVASHDLQEPLRMVSGYLQLIERRYADRLDDKGRRFIGFAVEGAQRMRQLILDLLSFSRITTRARPFEEVDAEAVLAEVQADLAELSRQHGARIEADPLPRLRVDATQLHQLLQNLIANAIKFQDATRAPVVRVSARRLEQDEPSKVGPGWVLVIADNGIGIAPEYHERIFIVFQRLHPRDEYPGTGIGLAICRKIAERHGGWIRVESELGLGSRFEVFFPDHPPEPEPEPPTSETDPAP